MDQQLNVVGTAADSPAPDSELIDRLSRENAELRRIVERRQLDFRLIVDSIPVPVAVTTPDGEVEGVNAATLKYFNRALDTLQQWQEVSTAAVHPDDLPRAIAAHYTRTETSNFYNVEIRLRRHDGVYRWFNVMALPLRDTEGTILRWLELLIDIDERKRAELFLAGEKRLLEKVGQREQTGSILSSACDLIESAFPGVYCCIVTLDPSGAHFEVWSSERLPAGMRTFIEVQPVCPEATPLGAAIQTAASMSVDVGAGVEVSWPRWSRVAADHNLAASSVWPVLAKDGQAVGAVCVFHDRLHGQHALVGAFVEQITHIAGIAIKGAQRDAALTRSEACLAEAQSLSSTGSFTWHSASDEHYWSEETYEIFEQDRAVKIDNQLIEACVFPDDFHIVKGAQLSAAAGNDLDYECRFLMPSGTLKYLRIVAHCTQAAEGIHLVGAVQDVTHRRLADQALEKLRFDLERMARVSGLGTLTASIAHEVNQPLSGIMTNASICVRLLNADPPNIQGAIESAKRTLRDGDRASQIIKRLRGLFSNGSMQSEPLALGEAAREVLELCEGELRRRKVTVKASLGEEVPLVRGDRVQIQQVILNLVLNGAQAMEPISDRPRHLKLALISQQPNGVGLSVTDAGVGIPHAEAERLFEPFYTTKEGGMGIGLAVSRSIIEKHDGRIWATKNDGPGCTFTFMLPCEPERPG